MASKISNSDANLSSCCFHSGAITTLGVNEEALTDLRSRKGVTINFHVQEILLQKLDEF
jgi:hypothetical protein